MAKIETVIKGLECCRNHGVDKYDDPPCHECPYIEKNTYEPDCEDNLHNDAVAMLKEQEARIRELEEELRALKYGDQDTLKSAMMPAT